MLLKKKHLGDGDQDETELQRNIETETKIFPLPEIKNKEILRETEKKPSCRD